MMLKKNRLASHVASCPPVNLLCGWQAAGPVSCDPGGGKVCQPDSSCASGASGGLLGSLRRLGSLLAAVHCEFCFTVPKGDCSTLSLAAFLTALGLPERGV